LILDTGDPKQRLWHRSGMGGHDRKTKDRAATLTGVRMTRTRFPAAGEACQAADGAPPAWWSTQAAADAPATYRRAPCPPPGRGLSLADILSQLGHELRTPLNAVIGFANLLHRETYGALGHQRYREYVEHILASGTQLLRATEDALAMTTMIGTDALADAASADLARLVHSIADDLATMSDAKRLRIDCELPAELEVQCASAGVGRAIRSIAESVAAQAPAGSRLTFSVLIHDDRVRLAITLAAPGAAFRAIRETADLTLARLMLSLGGHDPVEGETEAGDWRLALSFEEVRQPDFFASLPRAAGT
jgi:hypothetical protein